MKCQWIFVSLMILAGCQGNFDLRGIYDKDIQNLSENQTAPRPKPDSLGVISYPTYQVVVAQSGDTVAHIAARVGVSAEELARYNGINPHIPLRNGEILALPKRVPAIAAAPVQTQVQDITTIAGNALDRVDAKAPSQSPTGKTSTGVEPLRHKVEANETAYSIARLYGISVRSLAEWNGLGPDLAVRPGQYLLIPVIVQKKAKSVTVNPGTGSPTPTPPSAATPLPKGGNVSTEQSIAENAPPSPNLGTQKTTTTSKTKLIAPVPGNIIRTYSLGKNDGIDIAAQPGADVRAADAGSVAAVTRDTDGMTILVLRHANDLLTVYTNIDRLSVQKGDKVSRGQNIAKVQNAQNFVHFEVRNGFDSTDPEPYLR